jgi:hypothetical protein
MKPRTLFLLAVMSALTTLSFQSLAEPPDFSICDGLQGTARGLCQAGVVIGCDGDNSTSACTQIAEQFENATGEPPPYAVVTISPTSGDRLSVFTITDLDGRIQAADFVIVYESGKDPLIDGYVFADNVVVDPTSGGTKLTGTVPVVPSDDRGDVTFLFRVTELDAVLTPRFGDLKYVIQNLTVCIAPACGGSGG